MGRAPASIRIGVSGWTYAPWRGVFYPEGLRQRDELAFAASRFNALEINGTFYGLQTPASFARWAEAVPETFVFAIKGSRFITHTLRLRDARAAMANFFASGLFALGDRLGPILWQLPPNFRFDAERIEAFLALLPHDTAAAASLALEHDHRLKAAPLLTAGRKRRLRHALEIRHESFRDAAFAALLRRYGVALVVADTVKWPCPMDLTADFVYCRLQGGRELYRSRYEPEELDRWADRIARWRDGRPMSDGAFIEGPAGRTRGRDVYCFFDNTDKLHAPEDARALMQRLEIAAPSSQAPDESGI